MKMPSTIAVRFLSVLILTFWVGTALADKHVALIVGNSQYTRITPKLINPANDAHDIAQALENIGFDVILRTDLGKGEFDRALAEFARKATGADTALFYYAGHGLQYHRQNYFLPTDIEVQDAVDVEYRAMDQSHILSAIGRAKGVKIVILDACRDNPLARQLTTRSFGAGGETPGLARIDSAEDTIVVYATAPDHVANDGEGRNSPFTAALIQRIKEPGLEITTMFRRVANDVYQRTSGSQQPEVTTSLRTDYYLNPTESDSVAWSRVRESTDPADFKEFIRKFPTSPFAREAQFRIDLFDRIRRENEEAAKSERERIARAAEQKRHEEEAKKQAERIAQQKSEAARLEAEKAAAQRGEAERLQAEKRAAEERAKIAALEEEDRKRHDVEPEKQRTAEICTGDLAKLKELSATLQTAAIQNLAKETACPTIKPAVENALREVARGVKRACDADRKTLASFKANDIASLKAALDHMSCETVRTEAQQRVAKVEAETQRKQSVCADEKTKLNAVDASAAGAREQYVELQAQTACTSLRADISDSIKKIDSRVKEAQTELARIGCYYASINGQFDEATKKSLALYNTKKGSLADGDHLTDGLLSELKQQTLALCPTEPPSAPVVATPGNGQLPSVMGPPKEKTEQAKREEDARPGHSRQNIESGGRDEEPASRPSRRHNFQSSKLAEEPVSRPPRHRTQRALRQEEPAPRSHQRAHPSFVTKKPKSVIAHAPRRPPGPTAESGSASHSGNISGVGF